MLKYNLPTWFSQLVSSYDLIYLVNSACKESLKKGEYLLSSKTENNFVRYNSLFTLHVAFAFVLSGLYLKPS